MASTSDDLFALIEADDVDGVRALLAEQPWLAAERDDEGVSPLLRARYRMDRGLIEAVRQHVERLNVFEAAAFGDLDRLSELLGEDPELLDARSGDGFTPLHLAAFFGQTDTVRLLLARGAVSDVAGTGWMTGTPLHAAAFDAARRVLADTAPDALVRYDAYLSELRQFSEHLKAGLMDGAGTLERMFSYDFEQLAAAKFESRVMIT